MGGPGIPLLDGRSASLSSIRDICLHRRRDGAVKYPGWSRGIGLGLVLRRGQSNPFLAVSTANWARLEIPFHADSNVQALVKGVVLLLCTSTAAKTTALISRHCERSQLIIAHSPPFPLGLPDFPNCMRRRQWYKKVVNVHVGCCTGAMRHKT